MWLSSATGTVMTISSPSSSRAFTSVTMAPLTVTCPSATSRASLVRERDASSGTSRASALSRRGGGSIPISTFREVEPMDNDPQMQPVDPAMVRYLRVLVTVLSATMIIGFIIIVALFVTRFAGGPDLTLPDTIALPDGAKAEAFTQGRDWYAVV